MKHHVIWLALTLWSPGAVWRAACLRQGAGGEWQYVPGSSPKPEKSSLNGNGSSWRRLSIGWALRPFQHSTQHPRPHCCAYRPCFPMGSAEIPGGSKMSVVILRVSLVAESEKVWRVSQSPPAELFYLLKLRMHLTVPGRWPGGLSGGWSAPGGCWEAAEGSRSPARCSLAHAAHLEWPLPGTTHPFGFSRGWLIKSQETIWEGNDLLATRMIRTAGSSEEAKIFKTHWWALRAGGVTQLMPLQLHSLS